MTGSVAWKAGFGKPKMIRWYKAKNDHSESIIKSLKENWHKNSEVEKIILASRTTVSKNLWMKVVSYQSTVWRNCNCLKKYWGLPQISVFFFFFSSILASWVGYTGVLVVLQFYHTLLHWFTSAEKRAEGKFWPRSSGLKGLNCFPILEHIVSQDQVKDYYE